MSPRNFARVFAREVGVTPAAYVESLRLERARTLLETGDDLQLEEIARAAGSGPSRRCAACSGGGSA